MKVKECMCDKVIWVKPNNTIREVAKIMQEEHIGCVPVCNDERELIGLVTDRDVVIRAIADDKNANTTKVEEIMSTDIYNVTPDMQVLEASKIMSDCQIKRIPVTEDNKIVGIITLGDLAHEDNVSCDCVGDTVQKICNCNNKAKHAD